jgi:hypothetical protein
MKRLLITLALALTMLLSGGATSSALASPSRGKSSTQQINNGKKHKKGKRKHKKKGHKHHKKHARNA